MSTHKLEKYFSDRYGASELDITELAQYFKQKEVSKEEVLNHSGEVCRYFYFINKGSLKACFMDSEGQESIRFVSFEDQFITTIHSFIDQTTSSECICACEKSDLLAISHVDFKEALHKFPFFKDFYIYMLERAYIDNHWRIESFLRLDAKQRYAYILQNQTKLVQRLSNKNLAHYIGITQESLSRIKAKI